MARHILARMPDHTCYCEPFAGGLAVLFTKLPSKCEVINDVNGELINLYCCTKEHLPELLRQIELMPVSRELFYRLRDQSPVGLTDIQRAARFFYLIRVGFGSDAGCRVKPSFGVTRTSGHKFNPDYVRQVLEAGSARLSSVTIEHMSWDRCAALYDAPGTVFYFDPPYYETMGYGVEFGDDQYYLLADFMRRCEGKVLLSINDHPFIRDVFGGFEFDELTTRYTVNNKSGGKPAAELLVRNF